MEHPCFLKGGKRNIYRHFFKTSSLETAAVAEVVAKTRQHKYSLKEKTKIVRMLSETNAETQKNWSQYELARKYGVETKSLRNWRRTLSKVGTTKTSKKTIGTGRPISHSQQEEWLYHKF